MALKEVMAERYPNWRVQLMNLQEVLEPVDLFQRVTGYQSQAFYNALLKRGWTFGSLQMLRALQKGIRLYSQHIEEVLQSHWQHAELDLVASIIPNFNGVMFRALRQVHAAVPYVTVMTDLADCPPHFWQEKQEQFIICGTDMAVSQAIAASYRPEQVFQAEGMILKPSFYRRLGGDRRLERERLGLDPDLPTALVMFGGYGSSSAIKIVDRLERSGLPVQSIVLCGHNAKLREALSGRKGCHAVGYTNMVPDYMRLADFFIGKPGPGSLSEALHLGLPAIVECNMRTMPQERYNVEWLVERSLGVVLKDFRQIADGVRHLLSDDRLDRFRQNALRLDNRAVYEIPEMLERIMNTRPASAGDRAGSSLSRGLSQTAGAEQEDPPRHALRQAKDTRLRLQPARLEQHCDGAVQIIATIETVGAPQILGAVSPMVVNIVRTGIRGVIGAGEFVVLGLHDAAEGDPEPLHDADVFALEIFLQMRVEELVMPEFVGGDTLADGLQHRFPRRLSERGIIGTGSGLDHAARDQLTRLRAATRCLSVEIDPVAFAKALNRSLEVEARIGERGPAPERHAVLNLLLGPVAGGLLKTGIVGEDIAEISRIVMRIEFDQGGCLRHLQDVGIHRCRIEAIPRDIVETPMLGRCHDSSFPRTLILSRVAVREKTSS